jgi:RNA polymerase sigma factor (sigma-70 family)
VSERPPSDSALSNDDAPLVVRARAGDVDAFGQLVRRHERGARALARSLVRDPVEAEDLAQDAFVRAYENLELLADPARFGAWLRRIVFGVCIDWVRRFRPERWRTTDVAEAAGAPGDVPTAAADPLTHLEREELAERVRAAVRALPERYRRPLTLYHLDGVRHARIAEALGVTESTARSLVTRARQRLRADLAEYAAHRPAMRHADSTVDPDDVFAERPTPRFLHVLNGDSTRELLERSSVPGTFAVWADVLHDGPVPPIEDDPDGVRWREVRARFIAGRGWGSYEEVLASLGRWDAALARHAAYDEVVIWCEHDLFDQLLLIRHLAWFAERTLGDTTLSLICIGEWPGRPHFKGLGELAPDDLASLLGTRQRVTQRQLALGRRAWRAYTAPDPRAIERFLAEEEVDAALPFLAGALRRHLEEFPAVHDGLARTDRQLLQLIAGGTTRLGDLFPAIHRLERQFFIGDSSFLVRLRRLADGPRPLARVQEGGEQWWRTGSVTLTDDGRDVLAGRADGVRLAGGIDEWRGGVHLTGGDAGWRWHVDAGKLRHADDMR